MKKEQFDITGMTCSACSSRVEGCVVKLPGVETVENTGCGAIPKDAPQRKAKAKAEISTAQAEYKAMKQRLLLSAIFTLPLAQHSQENE